MNKQISISIGIPTYEASNSLVAVIDSIKNQDGFDQISLILIVTDGKVISPGIKKQLEHPKISIIANEQRKGQSARINQILDSLDTDLIILSNDDVVWNKSLIKNLVDLQKTEQMDLLACNILPLKPLKLFERVISIGNQINHSISSQWNSGDNYLACNGRCLALSQAFASQIKIPEELWNNDAYIYLQAKLNKFTFACVPAAKCYYQSCTNLKEHLRQSAKFQKSFSENQHFIEQDISGYYQIPKSIQRKVFVRSFFKKPVLTSLYLFVFVVTRLYHSLIRHSIQPKGYWQTDNSTKNINSGQLSTL